MSVRIGGQPAELLYAGGAPGQIARVLQVNARVPENIAAGKSVPVELTAGGVTSPAEVSLAVR